MAFRHMVPSSKGASAKLTNGTGKILLQAVEMSKIILEIPIDICYTDSVPLYIGTDETLPALRGSVSADKFVRKVSNWKTIPSIS